MAIKITNFSRQFLTRAGSVLSAPALPITGADQVDAYDPGFSHPMGQIVRFNITVDADGGDSLFSKNYFLQHKFFARVKQILPPPLTNGSYVCRVLGVAGTYPFSLNTQNAQSVQYSEASRNWSARCVVSSGTSMVVQFDFYITSDADAWYSHAVGTYQRLFAQGNLGAVMYDSNTGNGDFATNRHPFYKNYISLAIWVQSGTTPAAVIQTTGGLSVVNYPCVPLWYGMSRGGLYTDTGSGSPFSFFLQDMTVTAGGNTITTLAALTSPMEVSYYKREYDKNFVVQASRLSPWIDNNVTIRIRRVDSSLTIPSTLSNHAVIVKMCRVDNLQENNIHFEQQYEITEAAIPLSQTATTALDGSLKIFGPASRSVSSNTLTINFRVPREAVKYGEKYRFIVMLYVNGDANSVATPELSVTAAPALMPDIKSWLSDYRLGPTKIQTQKMLTGYHDIIRAGFAISLTSLQFQIDFYFPNQGLLAENFVKYITADLNSEPNNTYGGTTFKFTRKIFRWTPSNGVELKDIDGGATIGSDSYREYYVYFRLDEELKPAVPFPASTNFYGTVRWEIGLGFTAPNGDAILIRGQLYQRITPRRWEQETPSAAPYGANMAVYDETGYPASKVAPGATCGRTNFIVEVSKASPSPIETNVANLIPGVYEEVGVNTTAGSYTNDGLIQQRFELNVGGGFPETKSEIVTAYDSLFDNASDIARAYYNISKMKTGRQYWATALLLRQKESTNLCPILSYANLINITYSRTGTVTRVTVDTTPMQTAITTAGGSSLTIANTPFMVRNRETNDFTGITAATGVHPSTVISTLDVNIDHNTGIKAIGLYFTVAATFSGVEAATQIVQWHVRYLWFILPTTDVGSTTIAVPTTAYSCINYGL